MTLIILSALATISYPLFDEQLDKSRLAELVLRIDAMRTAATTSIEEGNPAFTVFSPAPAGQLPSELTGIVTDSLQYQGLEMMLIRSPKTFHQFQGGIDRPYLMISATAVDSMERLRHLSEILPESIWAWWTPSAAMVIPLIEDRFLQTPPVPGSGGANPGTSNPGSSNPGSSNPGPGSPGSQTPAGGGSSSGGQSSSSSSGGTGTASGSGAGSGSGSSGTQTSPGNSGNAPGHAGTSPGNSGNAPGHSHHQGCSHPGNGHGFGRCS